MTPRCPHALLTHAGELRCDLEHGHGQPHQGRLANDAALNADDVLYRARSVVVWVETRELGRG